MDCSCTNTIEPWIDDYLCANCRKIEEGHIPCQICHTAYDPQIYLRADWQHKGGYETRFSGLCGRCRAYASESVDLSGGSWLDADRDYLSVQATRLWEAAPWLGHRSSTRS